MSRKAEEGRPTLCLVMMVKNEAAVIARALRSVRPVIDAYSICDTGSTDGTQAIIRDELRGIPGKVHDCEWVNFGHNRTEAIRLAAGKADYLLVMDADMEAVYETDFRPQLKRDYYEIRYTGPMDYCQPMLVRSGPDWQYLGVTHEYLNCDITDSWAFLDSLKLAHHEDGGNRAEKFTRDVRLLEDDLKENPDSARSWFYLGQSYRDLNRYEEALGAYEKRAAHTEGWEEERWYASYQVALMKQLLGHPDEEIQAAYQLAINGRPHRLEPLCALVNYLVQSGRYLRGYQLSSFAIQGLNYPDRDKLFIERWVYTYQLYLLHAACALACGRITETLKVVNLIQEIGEAPEAAWEKAEEARHRALDLIYGEGRKLPSPEERPAIKVLVPFRNAGSYLHECAESLRRQDCEDFEVIFLDDASEDESADFSPQEELRSLVLRQRERRGSLRNVYEAVMRHCSPDDIVVIVDGDDYLLRDDALSLIRDHYARFDCWLLYGQYRDSEGRIGVSMPYSSPEEFANLRHYWRSSHVRTFRAGLLQCLPEQDPALDCFRDAHGEWYTAATDAAMMYPLMEMAGFYKVHFNGTPLYYYRLNNPNSHHNQDRDTQREAYLHIQTQRPFARIPHYQPKRETSHA